MMHGGHHHVPTDRVASRNTSYGGAIWRLREDVAGAPAARMQTVFWKHMEIDIAKSCSERVSCHVEVRLMVLQNGSTQRDEVCMCVYILWSTWGMYPCAVLVDWSMMLLSSGCRHVHAHV
jgi:hypothetical protein